MNKRFHVLVFPGGTEIGQEIYLALRHCREVRLSSVGDASPNHAPFTFANHHVVPSVHEAGWLAALVELAARQQITHIMPAHDDVLLALASSAEQIPAAVVTSPLETCLITRSKSATYRKLAGLVAVPRLYDSADKVDRYPVFVKPDRGQGSQRTHLASSADDLRRLLGEAADYIVLEYLSGDEFTVDCFSDRERGLLFCGARKRIRTRSGIAMRSAPAPEVQSQVEEMAKRICAAIEFHGAWFFQVKYAADGELKLLEAAPRIAGTMALHRVQGVNFPLLSLYEQQRVPLSIAARHDEMEIDRALVNRYRHDVRYSTVYVDLDDTLIVDGRVNVDLVKFLYQCLNRRCRLVLVTRHAGDLTATLRMHRLHGLFDEIVHLGAGDDKAAHIRGPDAIFVDDSFSERMAVERRTGVATFDGSMIEMLLDDRAP